MLQARINIGDFDTKIVLEINTPTRDSVTNEELPSWATYATVWSKIILRGSSTKFEAEQRTAVNEKEFMVRYSSTAANFNEKMRILYDGEYYYITGVKKEPREGWIVLTSESRDND